MVDDFRKGKFKLLALTETNEEEIKRYDGVGKWHHCQCSGDGKS